MTKRVRARERGIQGHKQRKIYRNETAIVQDHRKKKDTEKHVAALLQQNSVYTNKAWRAV